jgi:hypothetical protein
MTSARGRAALLIILLWCGVPAWADDTADALAFFKEYVARSDRFDPGLADLYAEDAAIRSKRLMPDGKTQTLSFSGAQWKALIQQAMPLAKQRGDRNTLPHGSERPQRSGFVGLYQPRIADHIGCQDGSEPSFHQRCHHQVSILIVG